MLLIDAVRERSQWTGRYASATAWVEHAAGLLGRSPNTVWRMLSSRAFVDHELPRMPEVDPAVSGKLSSSLAEILRKIAGVDRKRAVELLVKIGTGNAVSIRDAREDLNAAIAKGSALPSKEASAADDGLASRLQHARRERLNVIEGAHAQVRANLADLSPGASSLHESPRRRLSYAPVDAVAIGVLARMMFIDGYRYLHAGQRWRMPFEAGQMLAEAAFAATFFRRYWIVLVGGDHPDLPASSPNRPRFIDIIPRVLEYVAALELDNIGFAWFSDAGDALTVIRMPRADGAAPDRQDLALRAFVGSQIR